MLFVWITSYMFVAIVGGILSLSAFFYYASAPRRKSKKAWDKLAEDVDAINKPESKVGPNPFNS